jgi:2-polyprenyl-3-methyl-5-hydroxy-6-metoxy-1,4-benzoquinol methylase
MKLTDELWQDSQTNELYFWKKELEQDNLDQRQRNVYYMSRMEGHCSLIKDFVESTDLSNKVVMDLGSGPMGFMHAVEAKKKFAVDPLMDEFEKLGYDTAANDVISVNMKAEDIGEGFENQIDVIFCLNSIDHHQDPQLVVDQCYKALKSDGHLIILTDTRLPEQCDAYHKLPLTKEAILDWLSNFEVLEQQVFPHGTGNPIMQFIVHAAKP